MSIIIQLGFPNIGATPPIVTLPVKVLEAKLTTRGAVLANPIDPTRVVILAGLNSGTNPAKLTAPTKGTISSLLVIVGATPANVNAPTVG